MKVSDEEAIQHTFPGIANSSTQGIRVEGSLSLNDTNPLISDIIRTNYASVSENFNLTSSKLTSLEGCPKLIGRDCLIAIGTGSNINSFKGCPQRAKLFKYTDRHNKYSSLEGICRRADTFRLYINGLTSYHNVHKWIDSFRLLEMSEYVKESILGFVLVKEAGTLVRKFDDSPLDRAIEIVDNHTGEYGDVLECQEELINSGFKEYARL